MTSPAELEPPVSDQDGLLPLPRLSIVVVSWNTAALLRACLRSLEAGSAGLQVETIVVDNASPDDSGLMVRREFPGVRLIQNSTNAGYARANNQGIAESHAPYVMLLNSDTQMLPAALPGLLDFVASHPEAGAAGPRLMRPDGSPQPFAFGGDPTIGYLLARGLSRVLRRRYLHDWATQVFQPVDWVSGACLLVRRSAIEQAGLLDENFFMYFEDNDWCLRLRRAGWKIYFVPQAQVVHLGGRSVAVNPAARNFYAQSLSYFYRKHYSPLAQWLLRLLLPIYRRVAG
jgi:N-acetylglucosaminyl-diphospho-decaprenol L-rhamnosyltransferase